MAYRSDGEKWNQAAFTSSSVVCLKHIPSFPIMSGFSFKNLPRGMHILCLWSAFPAEVINVQLSASLAVS